MSVPQKAIDLENTEWFDKAYEMLKPLWLAGDRDRELGLHLMFLSWYGILDERGITGFPESMRPELNRMLEEVHDYYEPQIKDDAEMLYAFGLAAHLFWFMFDNMEAWEKRAAEYRKLYRALEPNGLDPSIFHNRGAYGDYYAHQAQIKNGY